MTTSRVRTILGLDVSTTTAGWTIVVEHEGTINLLAMGYIPLGKYKTLLDKADKLEKELSKIIDLTPVDAIFIEEDLQRFTPGQSSAAVLQKLSRFNGMAMLLAYKVSKTKPEHVNVTAARKMVGCLVDRKDKSKTTKEKVFDWILRELPDYVWPTKLVKRGKKAGEAVKVPECYDMADSYVVAKAGAIILSSS